MENHDGVTAITAERQGGYRFRVRFTDPRTADLVTDESPPLGSRLGPNPVELLGAAVGTCMASSLLYCLHRAHIEPGSLEVEVEAVKGRDSDGRLRVQALRVRLIPAVGDEARGRMRRCAELFESFCTVAESVRAGIPMDVLLEPRTAPEPTGREPAERCA
jgi:organic hydroperoxide reductase OsmC/OhrA